MPVFDLTLQQTYFEQGFFNVVTAYDRYVRTSDGPVLLQLGKHGPEINATVNRTANRNGTPRILGGAPLREWFQRNFQPMDIIAVDLTSQEVMVLEKK